jgi:hypothetical protein
MKYRIQLTDPDGLKESMDKAVQDSVVEVGGVDEEERNALSEVRTNKFMRFAKSWLGTDACATIEFDTEAETATLIARSRPSAQSDKEAEEKSG